MDNIAERREELAFWIEANNREPSSHRASQIEYFRNKIYNAERSAIESKWKEKIPGSYIQNISQTMAILIGKQITTSQIEHINNHAEANMAGQLSSMSLEQYERFAAEIIPEYKEYLSSKGRL